MLYAEKGNKVKEIDESMIESCVQQGYRVVDERGTIIQDTIPTDMASLKLAYKKHVDTIKALKAEVDSLKAELQALKTKPVQEVASKTSKGKSSKTTSEE